MDIVGECVGMPVAAMRKGALDDFSEEEYCDTVRNIREICEALRDNGKKVECLMCKTWIRDGNNVVSPPTHRS